MGRGKEFSLRTVVKEEDKCAVQYKAVISAQTLVHFIEVMPAKKLMHPSSEFLLEMPKWSVKMVEWMVCVNGRMVGGCRQ